jgi:hypothetical protein
MHRIISEKNNILELENSSHLEYKFCNIWQTIFVLRLSLNISGPSGERGNLKSSDTKSRVSLCPRHYSI